MSTGFVPSSVSTVCVTRQPGQQRSRGISVLAGERAQGFGLHASSGIGGLAVLLRQECCARICPWLQEIGRPRPSRRLPVVLTPDEVVRILGFLEGEHRLFAQLLNMERACGSVRVCNCGSGSGFLGSRTIIVRGGQGLQGSALMLPESLAPSYQRRLIMLGMVAEGPDRGRSGVALPDALERKYPRARRPRPWFTGFAQHTHSTDPRACRASPSHV